MKRIYDENKHKTIKIVQKGEVKRGEALKTKEDFENAKKNLCFALDEDKMIIAHKKESGSPIELEIIIPAMCVMFGNSLTDLGGRPEIEGVGLGKRQFTVNLVDGDLHHPQIDIDNPEKQRKETTDAMFDLLEEVRIQAVMLKLRNSDVHTVTRRKVRKLVNDRMGPEFDKNVEKQNEELFVEFYSRFKYPIHSPSESAKKYYGETPRREIKLCKADFIEYKDKNKVVTIDPRIMDIFNAGPSDKNPKYAIAKEVVDFKALGKQFIPLNITHNDPNVKLGVFGPFCGRNSTAIFKFNMSSYAQTDFDGINFYIVSGQILIGEDDVIGGAGLITDYKVNHGVKKEPESGTKRESENGYVVDSNKRAKTEEAQA